LSALVIYNVRPSGLTDIDVHADEVKLTPFLMAITSFVYKSTTDRELSIALGKYARWAKSGLKVNINSAESSIVLRIPLDTNRCGLIRVCISNALGLFKPASGRSGFCFM